MAIKPHELPDKSTAEAVGSGAEIVAATVVTGSSAGGERTDKQTHTGASITPRYHDREQDIVGIGVEDLEDFQAASVEEFWQFVIGEFLVAGSFWLGVERVSSVPVWEKDVTFWICVVSFFAGLVIGFFGYRQLSRRHKRIQNIINVAKKRKPNSVGT